MPDELPFVTGSIGLLGTKPSYELMMGCDTLLVVGSSFPYAEFLPKEGAARGVQIDIDARMIGIRYPMDVHLVGDAAETLRALVPRLKRKTDRSWREQIECEVADWWQVLDEQAQVEADPVNPQRVFAELSPRLPDDCILTADAGSVASWYARHLKMRRGMKASLSGTLASMGSGVPYAIAAKFTHPDRVAIALVGDGSMQMNGLNELITIAKYWEHWSDPRLVVLVLNNRDLNMVTWEQRALEGDPKFEASQEIPDFPYARYAELLGLRRHARRRPRRSRRGLGRGAFGRPAVRPRGRHRPRGAAAAASHHVRTGEEPHARGRARRRGLVEHARAVVQGEAERARSLSRHGCSGVPRGANGTPERTLFA